MKARVEPIYDSLPEEQQAGKWGSSFGVNRLPPRNAYAIVACWDDARRVENPVYVDHGVGQVYDSVIAGYAGGPGFDHCRLFLCPNEATADKWRARYEAPIVVIGDPALDPFVSVPQWQRTSDPFVAFAFHHDPRVLPAPEAKSALAFWAPLLLELLPAFRFRVIGTGHPRAWGNLKRAYESVGIEPVENFADVVKRADVLACDNSSVGFMWQALGRPTVWLGSPEYRKGIHLPPRFPPIAGEEVQTVEELVKAVRQASRNLQPDRIAREKAAKSLYGRLDGKTAWRGAQAIMKALGD